MFTNVIKKFKAGMEIHNQEAKIKLVLHTSVLRFPYEKMQQLLMECQKADILICLPATCFYELRELILHSQLFGKKAEALMATLKAVGVTLMEESIEDFYVRDPWAAIQEDTELPRDEKENVYHFLFGDQTKLYEFLRFVKKSDYHFVALPSEEKGYEFVIINNAKESCEASFDMKICEYGQQLSDELLDKRAKQRFFAAGPYISLCDLLKTGGEGRIYSFKEGRKRTVEADSLAKIFLHEVSEIRKEKLERLKSVSGFFSNVCTIKELLLEEGSSKVQGIILEKVEGETLSDYINKSKEELAAWDDESVLRSLLCTLLELNICSIYMSDISLQNMMITKNNVLKIIDFDGAQFQAYTNGGGCKPDYINPLHKRNMDENLEKTFFPIFQNYSILVIFIKIMILGNQYIPDSIPALRRKDGISQISKEYSKNGDADCVRDWETFCAAIDGLNEELSEENKRTLSMQKKARALFENVFRECEHVTIGNLLEMMEA